MESAKKLSRILSEFQKNAITGGFIDDKKLGEHFVNLAQTDPDAPPLAKFLSTMGDGSGFVAVGRYWQFRDQICDYQIRHGISGVEWESVTWRGEKIRFPNYCDQLNFMPQDKGVLSRHKHRTVAKYLDFIQRYGLVINVEGKTENEESIPVPPQFVIDNAPKFDYAWLGHGWENSPVYWAEETLEGTTKTSKKIAYYLSEYSLCLTDFPTDERNEESIWITARVETQPD